MIRMSAPDAAGLGLRPVSSLDYGSYLWLELDTPSFEGLQAAGVPHRVIADARQVRVPGYRFDPLTDGEPQLAPELRSPAGSRGFHLVQVQGPARSDWLAALSATGLRVIQYYPHHSYLVWGGPEQLRSAAAQPFVRWHGTFHPAYKIHSDLTGRSGIIEGVEVVFYDDGDVPATVDALVALGGEVLSVAKAQPDGALMSAVLKFPAAQLTGAARLEPVLWMGYRSLAPALEDEMSDQILAGNHPGGVPVTGYLAHLGNLGVDGTGVTWAIVDTGVDYDHPDLGPRIIGGFSVPGTNCNPPGQPGSDCPGGGHGTHVAGIALGDASGGFTDSDGFLYGLGMAPQASIFAINIFGNNTPFQEFSKRAFQGGALGSNNSWTTGEGTAHGYQASERTYDFMVRDADFDTPAAAEPHVVVFSAGNSGPGSSTLTAPKEAKNVIVTAGTQNYRTTQDIDAMYVSSSRGPAVDGRLGVTIATPGQTIASTRNDLGGSCASAISGTNNLYAFCTGTSMASPHASGSVVLLAQWWRSFNGGADPSPAMAKALLVNTAVDISTNPAIPNTEEGWGRVNITDTIQPATAVLYFDQETLLDDSGDSWVLNVDIADLAEPLKVTLTWSDAPGALGANPALVNDLDLTVEAHGNSYLGNRFVLGWSQTGGSADVLNNTENVYLQKPGATATVTVSATAINGDGVPLVGDSTDQDFALICYNCVVSSGDPIFSDDFESGDVLAWSGSAP